MFLSNQCRKVAEQRLPDRFLRGDFGQFFDSPRRREAARWHIGLVAFQLTPAKSRRGEVPLDSNAVGGDQPANGFSFKPQDRAASAGFAKLV